MIPACIVVLQIHRRRVVLAPVATRDVWTTTSRRQGRRQLSVLTGPGRGPRIRQPRLKEKRNNGQSLEAVQRYKSDSEEKGEPSDTTSDVVMENGEGIVGHRYLHGTNEKAGDFQCKGATSVKPLPDGTYEVTVNSDY